MVKNYTPLVIPLNFFSIKRGISTLILIFFHAAFLQAQADLSISKTVDNATPNVGDEITFTISVSNAGPNVATGVTVRDLLPNGYGSLVNINNGGGLGTATEVLWPNLTIPVGVDVVTLTVTATVLPVGDYNNQAEIIASDQVDPDSDPAISFDLDDGRDGDPNPIDDDETNLVEVVPMRADLSLTKTVDNPNPQVGSTVTFTLTITNAGPDIATGVAIQDILPSGYGNIINISNGGSTISNNINWTGLTVDPNLPPLELIVTATVLETGDYNNRAQIVASAVYDPNSDPLFGFDMDDYNDGLADNDETDFVEVDPLISDLSIEKTASNLTPNIGREVDFTITVTNNGPLDASNIVVSDVLNDGFIYLSDDGFGDYDENSGEWTIASLPNGDSVSLTITAIVSLEDNYSNTAEIMSSDSFDPNISNNSDTVVLEPEEIFYAEGFSPNGDNINDTFEIPGLGFLYPDFKLEIYNRWGNKVYDYNNNGRTEPIWWDGISNGNLTFNGSKQVPTGTYYYVIYFNKDNKEPISNWIYLNR